MRRILFKSPNYFKGFVEAIYYNDVLWKISFSNASEISKDVIKWFKNSIPVMVDNLEETIGTNAKVIIENAEFEVSFEDFKREYPYSRNMHLVAKEWLTLKNSELYLILVGAMAYNRYCTRNNWYKPMLPLRFIKDKEYLNNWDKL